jgi:hypothetical protein
MGDGPERIADIRERCVARAGPLAAIMPQLKGSAKAATGNKFAGVWGAAGMNHPRGSTSHGKFFRPAGQCWPIMLFWSRPRADTR